MKHIYHRLKRCNRAGSHFRDERIARQIANETETKGALAPIAADNLWMDATMVCLPTPSSWAWSQNRPPLAAGRTRATGPDGYCWGITHTPLAGDVVRSMTPSVQTQQEALCILEHAVAPLQLGAVKLVFLTCSPPPSWCHQLMIQPGSVAEGYEPPSPLVRRSLTKSSAAFFLWPLVSNPTQ